MKIPYWHVDAFTKGLFGGNPAGVCVLDSWLHDESLQAIAAENNLSETAFVVRRGAHCDIRWFTPKVEVDLCGHATLAAAHVLFAHAGWRGSLVEFRSQSGRLLVERKEGLLVLDFPARPPQPRPAPDTLLRGLGAAPAEVYGARDYLAVYATEAEVRGLAPDMELLTKIDLMGVIATSPAADPATADFVSRFFAPSCGIPEDPVTGSAHCTLVPYWSKRLGRKALRARQVSARGGELFCEDAGERVKIGGRAVTYLAGELEAPEE
jgi:PhzF family phenazine biosynthesis protein